MDKKCAHLDQIATPPATAHSQGCEDCEKTGDKWVAVRLCLTCGHTGCCDSSKNGHARKHFHDTKHAVIEPLDGSWRWCYVDDAYV